MKNFFSTGFAFLLLHTVVAQTKIGIRAGWNYGTAKISVISVSQKTEYISGYTAGIFLKAPFEGVLHFSPSLNFSHRGYSYMPSQGSIKNSKFTVDYIDIVPGISFDYPTSKNSVFILGLSPVLGIAFTGKEKNTFRNDSTSSAKLIFNYSNYSRFDVGITGSVGYKFNNIILEAAYFYSPTNVENDESLLRKIQNRVFSVTFGYYLK